MLFNWFNIHRQAYEELVVHVFTGMPHKDTAKMMECFGYEWTEKEHKLLSELLTQMIVREGKI